MAGWTQIIGSSLKDYVENAEREIVVAREFDAPRELVWEAMTEAKHVVNWWGPRGFSTTIETMDFRVGGVWKHVMRGPDGAKYPNKSIFREIVRPERIVYSHGGGREHGPGASFVATWTFEALAADRTRVTLRLVFPSAAERDLNWSRSTARSRAASRPWSGWANTGFRGLVPFVRHRGEFNAPREVVWKAWTERERLRQWFGPKGFKMTTATMDFRPGGSFHYRLQTPDGKEMWGRFVYRQIVAPERILWVNSFSGSGRRCHAASSQQ